MKRFPDWAQRLARAIHERRNTPHAYGSIDCCLYSADLVNAETGQDFGAMFRGLYSDEEGAKAILAAHKFRDLGDVGDHCLGARIERPQRGDLVLQEGVLGPYLGIAWQGGVISAGVRRPTIWPMRGILAAWRVG